MSLLIPTIGFAQPFSVEWYKIADGGGTSTGGQYVLTGTIGQPDAANSTGGDYKLLGGFWPGGPLCMVELADLALFASYWLDEGFNLPADLNSDEVVDLYDFGLLANHWLGACPYNWPLR